MFPLSSRRCSVWDEPPDPFIMRKDPPAMEVEIRLNAVGDEILYANKIVLRIERIEKILQTVMLMDFEEFRLKAREAGE